MERGCEGCVGEVVAWCVGVHGSCVCSGVLVVCSSVVVGVVVVFSLFLFVFCFFLGYSLQLSLTLPCSLMLSHALPYSLLPSLTSFLLPHSPTAFLSHPIYRWHSKQRAHNSHSQNKPDCIYQTA